jgi:aminoglycoside phosphotransferase (APT) family kinase protein
MTFPAVASGRQTCNQQGDLLSWLAQIPEVRGGRWRPQAWLVERAWKHRGKTFVVGQLACRNVSDHMVTLDLLLEPFRSRDRGLHAFRALNLLWWAGLHSPSPYRVPKAFAWDDAQKLLVRAYVPGTTWADLALRADPAAADSCARVAEWLVTLQRIGFDEVDSRLPVDRPVRVLHYANELAKLCSDQQGTHSLQRVALTVAECLENGDSALVLAHGDFHPKNVLLAGPAVVAIDMDRLGLAEPAADVGRALGQLVSMSLARTHTTDAAARAGLRFWKEYQQSSGRAGWDRVAIRTAATLIECIHYTVYVRHRRWPGSPRDWAKQVERWARSDGPDVLARHYELG